VKIREPEADALCEHVAAARRVFLFLDYDGTLVPIAEKPELALPTTELLTLLDELTANERFRVAIVSGRDRRFLETLLPANLTLVAEHGASVRVAGESEVIRLVDATACEDLRGTVRAIMRDFEHRIPGSFIEEKELGVVWHYRMAEPLFAHQQALVLADTLGGLLQQTPLGVLMARKAVEVRHQSANKGEALRAVLDHLGFDPDRDALITAGDDRTDEDMFRVQMPQNVSISVGDEPLAASYVMERGALLALLAKLAHAEPSFVPATADQA
jgi:trehalose 6-phosphate synthase/phosphatase